MFDGARVNRYSMISFNDKTILRFKLQIVKPLKKYTEFWKFYFWF